MRYSILNKSFNGSTPSEPMGQFFVSLSAPHSSVFSYKKRANYLVVWNFCVNTHTHTHTHTHTESRAKFIIIFRHINTLAKRFSSFSPLLFYRPTSSSRLFFRRERCEVCHIRQRYATYDTVLRIPPMRFSPVSVFS